jgi:hypothetical protein
LSHVDTAISGLFGMLLSDGIANIATSHITTNIQIHAKSIAVLFAKNQLLVGTLVGTAFELFAN